MCAQLPHKIFVSLSMLLGQNVLASAVKPDATGQFAACFITKILYDSLILGILIHGDISSLKNYLRLVRLDVTNTRYIDQGN